MRFRHTIPIVFGLFLVVLFFCGSAQAQDYTVCLHPNYTISYGVYTAASADTTHIYTSVVTDGSANMVNYPYFCGTPTHQPQTYNLLNGVGGWHYGVASCASCYISDTNNQSIVAIPGTEYSWSSGGQVYCSLGGFCFTVGIPIGTLRIAVANYVYAGTAFGICTYNLYCRNSYASCGFPTVGTPVPCPGDYFVQYSLVYRVGLNSKCFSVSFARFSTTPVDCS
jgi:hypothetical protein